MNPWTTPGTLGAAIGAGSSGASIGSTSPGLWTSNGQVSTEQAKELKKDDYSNWNGDWLGYMEYKASQGDVEWQEKLFNYYMSEASEDKARQWTAEREDTAMQRWVADAKAAGISPYALLAASGSSPIASSSSGNSYSGSQLTTRKHQETTEAQAWFRTFLSLIPMVAALAVAAL